MINIFSPVQPDQYAQKSPESFYVGGTGGGAGGPAHANTPGSSNAEVGGAAGSHGTNVSNSDKR